MADEEKPQKPPLPGGKPPPPPISGAAGKPPLPGASKPPLPGSAGQSPAVPPSLPSIPGLPPFMGGGMPPLPGASSMPAMPSLPKSGPPAPPSLGSGKPSLPSMPGMASLAPMPPMGGAPMPPQAPGNEKVQMERKLADLEKKLAEEREKLLVASVKRESEAANAAKVEVSIKELQEKLRRDRREQESEESKLKLEGKVQEMEQRLAQERETWVTTLKGQLAARENQDKELETHFAMRVQELERRWLEEKAQWQRVVLSKEEEIRNLRSLSEKLKGADVELSKVSQERKWLETRVHELTQERAEAVARLAGAIEKEKENIQLRGDLQISRQQVGMVQDRLERELQGLRLSSKEREERLLSDQERLQRELSTVADRLRVDHEADLRRVKADGESETLKYKEAVERAAADMQKLRGIAGALERQLAASRAQLGEMGAARASWEKTQERFKAEFVVLQRKWVEREKEIRAESDERARQMLEAEKARIKVMAQEEINARAARIAEQLGKDRDTELKRAEMGLRAQIEGELAGRLRDQQADHDKARQELQSEIERLHQDLFKKEAEWAQRLMTKDSEAHKAATRADEASSRLSGETAARQALERQKLDSDKSLSDAREELGRLRAQLDQSQQSGETLGRERAALAARQEELERLCTAQAAQVANLQDLLDQARGELAREVHLARLYLKQKEQAEGGK